MDKYCDKHTTCRLVCPACNGEKGGRLAKGALSRRKTISSRINMTKARETRKLQIYQKKNKP